MSKYQRRGTAYQRVELLLSPTRATAVKAFAEKLETTRTDVIGVALDAMLTESDNHAFDAHWKRSGAHKQVGRLMAFVQRIHGIDRDVALGVFFTERLLSHWIVRSGGSGISEDELLAEARAHAHGEVEQAYHDCARETEDGEDDTTAQDQDVAEGRS